MMEVEQDAFRSNGLLGGVGLDESSDDASDAFKLNGLLEDVPGSPLIEGSSKSTRQKHNESTNAFISNGLLDDISTKDVSVDPLKPPEPSLLPESQDDTQLPSFSQILEPYVSKDASKLPAPRVQSWSLRATTYDGQTLHLKRKRRVKALESISDRRTTISNLLDVPIHRLMDDLAIETAATINEPQAASAASSSSSAATLWTDLYRPKRFTDLVGDERVHRETLAWVKEWDFCVFGAAKVAGRRARKRAREDEQVAESNGVNKWGDKWEEKPDEWRRPKEKLLLLSGPPGLGKTTLAHVVARQAGYSVFEINASDARSGSIVDDRIRPALEAGGAVGKNTPYLVVIDEIDGATGAGDNAGTFVHKLIALTQDRQKKKGRKEKHDSVRPLLRPIICICNDLYASSLTKLRTHARIIRFTRPADVHLVKRLRTICETENLRADTRALSALVGASRGDFRGCLNTLQLLKARGEAVTERVVRAATAGMKEADGSYMSILGDMFAPLSKKRVQDAGVEDTKYVARLTRALEACGTVDRVAGGAFEHYVLCKRHDANFGRYASALGWLGAYDTLTGAMRNEREYALLPYVSYMLVPFYPLFQERGGLKVERPKADYENFLATRTNVEIYKSLAKGLRAASVSRRGDYRHLAGDEVLWLEFAPLINRIIAPPLRPVNSQVIKPKEKALLTRLVDIMVALELRFTQEKSEDNQLVYRLDPPLDVFVTYDGKRAADIAVSRYAVRHLVAQQIDAQSIARHAEAVERTKGGNKFDFFGSRPSHADEGAAGDEHPDQDGQGTLMRAVDTSGPEPKRAKTEKAIDIADRPPVDFFGRPITITEASMAAKKHLEKKYKVSYRFKEGNSAAVRRPVKVSSFL